MTGNSQLSIDGKVMIFCSGPVSVSGRAAINPDGNPKDLTLYSLFDDIYLSGHSKVYAELFANYGLLTVSGSTKIFGTLFADRLEMTGNSSFHFNEHEYEYKLAFVIVKIVDPNGIVIGEKISLPFKTIRASRVFMINVSNGHFVTPRGKVIALKGFSNYDLINEVDQFNYLVGSIPDDVSIFTKLSYYDFYEGPTPYTGWMNFYRMWSYYWTVADDPDSSVEQFRQPWKYMGLLDGKHSYDMFMPQDSATAPDYLFYNNRFQRIMKDSLMSGVVVEVDIFDNAMASIELIWPDYTFNPNNQRHGQRRMR